MQMTRSRLPLQLVILATGATEVSACGICAFAIADRYLPFIHIWCLAITIAFVAIAIAIRRSKIPVYFPSPIFALGIGVGAHFIGVGMFGPLLFILPAAACVIGVGHLARYGRFRESSSIRLVGIALALALCVLGGFSYVKATLRSDADYLIEWKGKAGSKSVLLQMAKRGPAGLDGVRRVLREGDFMLVGMAAETLAEFGEAPKDVPLLIVTLKRLREEERPIGGYASEEVEEALRILTGFRLPKGTKAEKWETAWFNRK